LTPLIELRVLSGPSLGAAIELAAGVHVIGADDDCDLVFAADTSVAGRHLELRVPAPLSEDRPPEVSARPLEGEIAINGTVVPESGAPLIRGDVLGLGFTAFAWQPIGGAWGRITLAPLEFARLVSGREAEKSPESAAGVSSSSLSSAPLPEALESGPPSLPRCGFRAGLAAVVAVVLIFALTREIPGLPPPMDAAARQLREILGKGRETLSRKILGISQSPDAAARQLREALETGGFRGIRVETDASRALVLRGTVENDRELRRVFDLAEGLPFRVHVEKVRVGGDLLRFTRETLNAHGFFPDVRYRDADRHDLALALYLKDGMVEAGMMASLAPDLPKLATASRKIVYARDLAPVLEAELSRIGLEGERAVYLAGKVILPYRLDVEARRKLDAALETVRENLGVPVVFQVTETAPDRLPEERVAMESGSPPAPLAGVRPAADGLGGLKVMSVTLGAIPFVTMTDQQKFFPGAVLPGGATLVGIHADRLILQADGETLTYLLKEES
jgi:type III secretion protein D